MPDTYDCITFHTPACDEHHDRVLNVHGPDGLDDLCPICEIERLEAELEELRATNDATVARLNVVDAENLRMREALQPFADAHVSEQPYGLITLHDLRVASDALQD